MLVVCRGIRTIKDEKRFEIYLDTEELQLIEQLKHDTGHKSLEWQLLLQYTAISGIRILLSD